jgi:secreted trypsin-like serine protease
MECTMTRFASSSLIAILALGLAACGADGDITAVAATANNDSIIGGQDFSDLPGIGMLRYDGRAHCTGVVVSPRRVATAAHCLKGFLASKMVFIIGSDISNPDNMLSVASVTPHPQFDANNIVNNIGYVTLYRDAPVAPLAAIDAMTSSWAGRNLLFVGYGVTDGYAQTGIGVKRAVMMKVTQVEPLQFRYANNGTGTCNGDAGGPALARDGAGKYYIVGLSSYTDWHCAQYGVHTRIDKYLSFLGITGVTPGPGDGYTDSPTTPTTGGGGTTTTPDDPCHGESYAGRCQGDTVIWCENNKVYQQDCTADGKHCKYDSAQQINGCI